MKDKVSQEYVGKNIIKLRPGRDRVVALVRKFLKDKTRVQITELPGRRIVIEDVSDL